MAQDGPTGPQELVFRVNSDPGARSLGQAHAQETTAAEQAQQVGARLEALISGLRGPDVSFSPIPAGQHSQCPPPHLALPTAPPEARLLRSLSTIGLDADYAAGAGARIGELVERLTRLCRVETDLLGGTVATTRLGWGGSADTVISPAVDAEIVELHAQAVALAVQTRHRWLATVASAIALAGRLASAATLPGGAMTALPLVLQFIADVRAAVTAPGR